MKKYLIRFLKCLLVIVCIPIWYIVAIICAPIIYIIGSLILFIIFYEKTGNTDDSWDKTTNTIDVILDFMFPESFDIIKEFLND